MVCRFSSAQFGFMGLLCTTKLILSNSDRGPGSALRRGTGCGRRGGERDDDRKIWDACVNSNWELVREKVNGGKNNLSLFLKYVNNLLVL